MTIACLAPRDLSVYHQTVRRRGIQRRPLHWAARATIPPIARAYFRVRRHGHRHIPHRGAAIIASNHRSFLDPFIISACVHRPAVTTQAAQDATAAIWQQVDELWSQTPPECRRETVRDC